MVHQSSNIITHRRVHRQVCVIFTNVHVASFVERILQELSLALAEIALRRRRPSLRSWTCPDALIGQLCIWAQLHEELTLEPVRHEGCGGSILRQQDHGSIITRDGHTNSICAIQGQCGSEAQRHSIVALIGRSLHASDRSPVYSETDVSDSITTRALSYRSHREAVYPLVRSSEKSSS
jgi:hypothetical protein